MVRPTRCRTMSCASLVPTAKTSTACLAKGTRQLGAGALAETNIDLVALENLEQRLVRLGNVVLREEAGDISSLCRCGKELHRINHASDGIGREPLVEVGPVLASEVPCSLAVIAVVFVGKQMPAGRPSAPILQSRQSGQSR